MHIFIRFVPGTKEECEDVGVELPSRVIELNKLLRDFLLFKGSRPGVVTLEPFEEVGEPGEGGLPSMVVEWRLISFSLSDFFFLGWVFSHSLKCRSHDGKLGSDLDLRSSCGCKVKGESASGDAAAPVATVIALITTY